MRSFPLLAAALTVAACTQPAQPPAPPLAPEAPPPAAQTATVAAALAQPERPFELKPQAGVVCRYTLKDVLTETLGDQLAAGHEVTVTYSLATGPAEGAALAYTLTVEHVLLKGKREAYSVELDSTNAGQMVRMRGGADTLLMFDSVLYFALLERPVRFEVDARGRLLRVVGGDAVRTAYLALHPPKPRTDPHQIGRVATVLSDEALARRFLPFSVLVPEQGPLTPKNVGPEEGAADLAEYAAKTLRARRIRWVGESLVIEEKRVFGPSEAKSNVPARQGYPEVGLGAAKDDTTVAMTAGDPCFTKAAHRFSVTRTWKGKIEDEVVTTQQQRDGTWLHDRAAP